MYPYQVRVPYFSNGTVGDLGNLFRVTLNFSRNCTATCIIPNMHHSRDVAMMILQVCRRHRNMVCEALGVLSRYYDDGMMIMTVMLEIMMMLILMMLILWMTMLVMFVRRARQRALFPGYGHQLG
jgi:hypothetical protein